MDGSLNVTGPVDVTGVISASRLASTTTGAAPFQVASSSKVIGLNADLLDGLDSSAFSQFGNRVDTNEIAPGAVTSAKLAPDLFLSGDLTVDINTLFVDASSNRVGIGTTSPGAKLDVNGSASVGNDLTVDDELDVGGRTTLADGNIIFTTNSGGAGFVEVQDGNGGPNVRISSNSANAGYGAITVFDANGVAQAGVQVNSSGDGLVWGDVKNFVADNPDDPNTRIWYASLEGPEAAAYVRGTATLIGGEATIELPRHFQNVSSEQDITVLVTPLSARSRGLAVVEKSRARIVVRERLAGSGTYDFDWEVKAVRRGFEDYQVVRDAAHADLALPVDLSSHDD